MLATHAIKASVAASKWRLFGRRKFWLVYGTGETVAITAKVGDIVPQIGDELMIIDVASGVFSDDRPILSTIPNRTQRLYANFESRGLNPQGSYAVWLDGSTITKEDVETRQYECMSYMMNDWFTYAEDEIALTLLVIKHGGPLHRSNHIMTRL